MGWTPVLAMSTTNETQRSEMLGAYAFLAKPFDLDEVVRVVARGVLLSHRGFASRRVGRVGPSRHVATLR